MRFPLRAGDDLLATMLLLDLPGADRIEETEKLLEKNKFTTLDTEALSAVEPFHYIKY